MDDIIKKNIEDKRRKKENLFWFIMGCVLTFISILVLSTLIFFI